MVARVDLTGHKFSRLTAVKLVGREANGVGKWLCQCDCGNTKIVAAGNLKSMQIKSCGCFRKEVSHLVTHGDRGVKEYNTWNRMKGRCYNESNSKYSDYGGRGIRVCERWLHSYENFLEDMGRAPSRNHSLDRIDVDGNYGPDNCRWATPKQQANNRRRKFHRMIRLKDGSEITLANLARALGLSHQTLANRIRMGRIPLLAE